jgi:hypothetical protein
LADSYNIQIDQGATYTLALSYKDSAGVPINLTGYTAAMQLRKTVNSATATLSLSSPSSGIVITGATGLINITITATQSRDLVADIYVYDLEITSGSGVVTRLIEGSAVVSAEVTR